MIGRAAAFALAAGAAALALAAEAAGAEPTEADRLAAAACIGGFEATALAGAPDDAQTRLDLARLDTAFGMIKSQAPHLQGLDAARTKGRLQTL